MSLPERSAAAQALLPGMALTVWLVWGEAVGKVCSSSISTLGGLSCCRLSIVSVYEKCHHSFAYSLFQAVFFPRTYLALAASILVGIDVLI